MIIRDIHHYTIIHHTIYMCMSLQYLDLGALTDDPELRGDYDGEVHAPRHGPGALQGGSPIFLKNSNDCSPT